MSKHLRGGLAVLGAVVLCASCASILGIQDPETVGRGGGGGTKTGSSSSLGVGGNGGAGANTSSAGGGGITSGNGSVTGAGGSMSCGSLTFCSNADPHCVDTFTDPHHCGGCDGLCSSDQACQGGDCQPVVAKTADYANQLTSLLGDYVATGLAMDDMGVQVAVGGTLHGTMPFNDTTSVTLPDPFVWLTDANFFTDLGYQSACRAQANCATSASHVAHDVSLEADYAQVLTETGLVTFDTALTTASIDAAHGGTGSSLIPGPTEDDLMIGGLDHVSLAHLANGAVAIGPPLWSQPITPASTVAVRVSAVSGAEAVAGGLDGPRSVIVGSVNKTVVGNRDAFVALFDGTGSTTWVSMFSTPVGKHAQVTAVSFEGSGVFVVGTYQHAIDMNECGQLVAANQETQMFAARLFAGDGSCRWARTFGSNDGIDVPTAVLDFGGGVAIVGATTAMNANFGGQDLKVPSPFFLLLLDDGDGSYAYSWAWGQHTSGQPVGLASDGTDLWVAGYYFGGQLELLGPSATTQLDSSYVVHFPFDEF